MDLYFDTIPLNSVIFGYQNLSFLFQMLMENEKLSKVMIVDLDAHQVFFFNILYYSFILRILYKESIKHMKR